jgi:hypothetical protein
VRSPLLVFIVCASAALGLATAASREAPMDESRVSGRPMQRQEDGFTSSKTCQACHPAEYASWHASYHRTMTQVATPETAIPSFSNAVVTNVHGRAMRLSERGRTLWAEFDDPDSTEPPDRRPRIERPVVMITGSHHQQIFWYATGHDRLIGQLPGAYVIAEGRWIPRRMAVLHPPGQSALSETGHWNSTCLVCHTTHGKPQFDTPFGSQPLSTQRIETTSAEFGIACESCHGPADEHVRQNRGLLTRYRLHLTGQVDTTIVQPTRLDPRRSSQVCGQCHGVWEFYDGAGERRANSGGLPYRPGGELRDTRFVAQPTLNADSPTMKALLADDSAFIRDAFWSDGKVRVSGREYNGLLESPCFKDAKTDERTMSCFSCHTLHKTADDPRPLAEWADDQLSVGRADNGACLQCHPALGENLTAHTKHKPDSTGSSCYNCHMPYTTYGLLKTIRSHTVSSPSVAESVQGDRPNACNLCHLDRTLGWTGEALERWYGTPSVPLGDNERRVAASVLWLLTGDAGLRAIVSQAMAWPPAQQISGTDWTGPYLAQLLDDPYDAVRFGAWRTLRGIPGFGGIDYDFVAPSDARRQAQLRTMAAWDRVRHASPRGDAELLMKTDGSLDIEAVLALLEQRNNRRMLLRE